MIFYLFIFLILYRTVQLIGFFWQAEGDRAIVDMPEINAVVSSISLHDIDFKAVVVFVLQDFALAGLGMLSCIVAGLGHHWGAYFPLNKLFILIALYFNDAFLPQKLLIQRNTIYHIWCVLFVADETFFEVLTASNLVVLIA